MSEELPHSADPLRDHAGRYAMHEHWYPDLKVLESQVKLAGLPSPIPAEIVLEFVGYWCGRSDTLRTESSWVNALCRQAKRFSVEKQREEI